MGPRATGLFFTSSARRTARRRVVIWPRRPTARAADCGGSHAFSVPRCVCLRGGSCLGLGFPSVQRPPRMPPPPTPPPPLHPPIHAARRRGQNVGQVPSAGHAQQDSEPLRHLSGRCRLHNRLQSFAMVRCLPSTSVRGRVAHGLSERIVEGFNVLSSGCRVQLLRVECLSL